LPSFCRVYRPGWAAAAVALLILAWQALPAAHDIPYDVTVQTFVKPEPQRLRLVVRVPLAAMRDMDYPRPTGATNADLLDLSRADDTLRDAATLWISDYLDLFENGERLQLSRIVAVRASLQSDRSFASYDEAVAHITGPPLPASTEFFWSQGLLDIVFDYAIHSPASRFDINPRLARLGIRTLTVIRYLPPDGGVRTFEFFGEPGLVRLDPRRSNVARQFVALGFTHLLNGTDYLLFLLCLVLPFRRIRPLLAVVTAFTAAHSITLIGSAYGFAPDALWFPPLIDTLIVAAIVYLAIEDVIIVTARNPSNRPNSSNLSNPSNLSLKRRWVVTFAFGLVYGFGFAFTLRPAMQFAGSHVLTAVLCFNLGLELALLLVLGVLVPAVNLLFRFLVGEWAGTLIVAALAAHPAWHALSDRFEVLRKFRFTWPAFDAQLLANGMRWMMLVVVAVGLYWLVFDVLGAARRAGDVRDAA
jgi:hypothetical protein